MPDREYLRISLSLARNLIREGAALFRVGAGIPIVDDEELTDALSAIARDDPSSLLDGGVIDEIPLDSEVWHWANAFLGFARYVAQMLQREIDQGNILRIADEVAEDS